MNTKLNPCTGAKSQVAESPKCCVTLMIAGSERNASPTRRLPIRWKSSFSNFDLWSSSLLMSRGRSRV